MTVQSCDLTLYTSLSYSFPSVVYQYHRRIDTEAYVQGLVNRREEDKKTKSEKDTW